MTGTTTRPPDKTDDAMPAGTLREYDRPPVVETILGVQFKPLPRFSNAHLGAFWKALGSAEWPAIADAPPLEPEFEQFAEDGGWIKAGMFMKLSQEFNGRLRMKNERGDRMVQLQNGRLIVNWLGAGGTAYPGYREVRERFAAVQDRFIRFLADENLGAVEPNQWEITYLNHIPKGTVWESPSDWRFFKPLNAVPTLPELIEGESFSGGWRFRIPDERGRLHVEWKHGRTETEEVIVLTLTARGSVPGSGNAVEEVLNGLDLGRRTIVDSFAKLMSDEANHYWGLKNASH